MLLKFCVILVFFLTYNVVSSCGAKRTDATRRDTDPDILQMSLVIEGNASAHIERLNVNRYLDRRQVVTCDGYILTVLRLMYKNGVPSPNRFPVLVVHGLFQSSDRFINIIQDKSLVYRLQDLGYDVWLVNLRGNKYSREHINFDPEVQKQEFFNYTYEEMAIYDLPSTVDYILRSTNKKKLHYIGHSIGTTTFLVLNSMLPEYTGKFISAYLLGPISLGAYPFAALASNSEAYENLLKEGNAELFPYTDDKETFSLDECFGNIDYKDLCGKLNLPRKLHLQGNEYNVRDTRGGSIKQLFHIAQNILSKNFSRWDYGEAINMEKYGKPRPPVYALDGISPEIVLFIAPNDELSNYDEVIRMVTDGDKTTIIMVPSTEYGHDDYIDGPDVVRLIHDPIVKDLNYKWSELQRKSKPHPEGDGEEVSHDCCSSKPCLLYVLITLLVVAICLGVLYLFKKYVWDRMDTQARHETDDQLQKVTPSIAKNSACRYRS